MLLFAQSTVKPEGPVPDDTATDSTATAAKQNAVPVPTTTLSSLAVSSSSSMTPCAMCHIASLCAALLILKAATLLKSGDTDVAAAFNKNTLWKAAEHIIQPLHDVEPRTTDSAKEAEHLSVLLVQSLLHTLSQHLTQSVDPTEHCIAICCKLLHDLLAACQPGVSQPLARVVAAAIASQSKLM